MGAQRQFRSEATIETAARTTGNHTDGVTVADLIAKVHGDRAFPRN